MRTHSVVSARQIVQRVYSKRIEEERPLPAGRVGDRAPHPSRFLGWRTALFISTASLLILAFQAAYSPARAACSDGGDGQIYMPGAGCGSGE